MATALPKITEREFTDQVAGLAKLYGWKVAHFRVGRTARGWATPVQFDAMGFPDLVLLKGSRLIFAELKVGRNTLSVEQASWIRDLDEGGHKWYVWYPEHWDEIERLLAEESKCRE